MLPRGGSEASRPCGGRRTCQAGGLSVRCRLPKGCSRSDSELGITACGIDLHRPPVVIAVLVGVDLLRLAAVCLRQQQGQQVEEFMIETLANLDEQLWNENGFLRELGKPKQILHIGILLDGLDGLLIAQPLNMLHYLKPERDS